MGLGKTAQAIAVLEYQRQVSGARGPFLVVAPLTTLGHWAREIVTWTGMVSQQLLSIFVKAVGIMHNYQHVGAVLLPDC